MLRDVVLAKIANRVFAEDCLMRLHLGANCCEWVRVGTYGQVYERQEPSDNVVFADNDYTLLHIDNVPCNCDYCAQWERKELAEENGEELDERDREATEGYSDKKEFLRACFENNSDVSDWIDAKTAEVEALPIGYFYDEKDE